jgi:hypothetical protein
LAIAAAATFGTVTTVAMCERSSYNCKDPNVSYSKTAAAAAVDEEVPTTTPQVQATSATRVKDPMTSFAVAALQKEKDLEDEKPIKPPTESEVAIEEAARKAKQHSGGLKIFSGNGNMALAQEIGRYLGVNLGKATVGKFADGEVNIMIHENVRGKDCYIIQPTGPPVNDNMMELLLLVSTLSRASARRITVVIPYYGYARQDRKMQVSYGYCYFGSFEYTGICVLLCCLLHLTHSTHPLYIILGSRSHFGC